MGQVAYGAEDFDATNDDAGNFPPSAQEVLRSWLVFVEQAMTTCELRAVREATDALLSEWDAYASYEGGVWWVQRGEMTYAVSTFQLALHDLRQASGKWEQAAKWLREYGDASKTAWYQPLYGHVLEQQQRLSKVGDKWQCNIER